MKTSLVCLLLLAAVACAAPKAGEARKKNMMPAVAQKIRGMAALARQAQEAPAVAEEAVADGEDTALEAVAGDPEERTFGFGSPCYGPCGGGYYGGFGCWFDGCYSRYDIIYYSGYCVCCAVRSSYQCY